MLEEETTVEKWGRKFGIQHDNIRCFLAELFGTFMLVLLIQGSVAQKVLTEATKELEIKQIAQNGTTTKLGTFPQHQEGLNAFLGIQLGHFVGITFGIFISGGISGGHINPAVTLAMAIIGRLKWSKVPFYMSGQFLGGFLAAPIVYAVYVEPANDAGTKAMGIWATGANEFTTTGMAIGDSIIGTFILVVVVMAVTDQKNCPAPPSMVPFCVGLAVMAAGLGFGVNGFALNPARDFGPRIFEAFLFGSKPFRKRGGVEFFFWIPGLIPFVGATLGAVVYILLIELHHPKPQQPKVFRRPTTSFAPGDDTKDFGSRGSENSENNNQTNL